MAQVQPLATDHLTSLEILSWPVVHDPDLAYVLAWCPELRAVAAAHGPLCAREPWRLAAGYAKGARVDVTPKRDSPLWVMSVNRNAWPDYQKMMTGAAYTLVLGPAPGDVVDAAACPYPRPLVPPLELEILYDKVPVDHSWGTAAARGRGAKPADAPPPPPAAHSRRPDRRRRGKRRGAKAATEPAS